MLICNKVWWWWVTLFIPEGPRAELLGKCNSSASRKWRFSINAELRCKSICTHILVLQKIKQWHTIKCLINPVCVKPQLFQSYNVSNLEKWLNFTFCRRFGIVWPFLSSAEWRRCQAILWGDWGLPVSWIAALQLLTCKALSTACGMCPKNSYWSLQLGNGCKSQSTPFCPPLVERFIPKKLQRGTSASGLLWRWRCSGFWGGELAVNYAQRYIGNHPQNGFFPENYGNCSDSVMRSGWLWWNDWSGCICKGQAEEAYGNFDRPDAACGWTDHPASSQIPKQSGPPKDFLLPKMQAISNHSRYRSIMIYIPVLEIYSKHCDPNSLTSFNYLFCCWFWLWRGPKCDSVAYPSWLSFPWTMWKLDSMGGPWRSSNWRSWDLCWRACSQPLVPCQAGLCCLKICRWLPMTHLRKLVDFEAEIRGYLML